MLSRRIIPCLDIKDGRTVKGVNFVNIRDAGDPVELASLYAQQGADELVFLDISATDEKRKTFATLVKEIARNINIPFTVGGGINSIADVAPLLEAGADKVSINSAAVRNPELINELSRAFGSQCIVAAIDARKIDAEWIVHTHGGKNPTDKTLYTWATECQERGAGEVLFTKGIYGVTRHPYYVGAILVGLGIYLILNSWFILIMLPIILFVNKVIKKEDQYLFEKFKDEWKNYKNKVGIIPFV